MSILTVNLKHLYQRRGIWVVYAFLGLFAFVGVVARVEHPGAGEGQYIGLVVLAFLIGLLAAALPIEVVTKPFSYCLPGHRKVARRFIFWVGAIVNFLASLLFLRYPGLHSWQLVLVVCSAFFGGLICYWLGVGLAFGIRNSPAVVGFLPLVIFGGVFLGLHVMIEYAIVENPFAVILAGVLSSVVVWFWLGDAHLARRYCAAPWVCFFDAWNRDKLQKYRWIRAAIKWDKLRKHRSPWVETFFLGRMNRCDYFSTGRYIWGALYTAFPIGLSQWKSSLSGLFVASLMVCFLGYMGPWSINMIFFMPGLMIAQMRLPVYSSMLISGGRSERYRGAMTLVITSALLITTMVTIIAASSMPLAAIMPDVTLRGGTFTFHAMIIELFFVPLLMIPIVFTIQLISYRRPIFIVLSIMLVFMLLFVIASLWHKQLRAGINPTSIASLVVLSWVLFSLVLRYICMRRCLVGQAKSY